MAVAILAKLGYQVAAVTGRPETEWYLKGLGASRIVPRAELAETVKRPLESETWAACVDAVGGAMLARVLGQMKYGGSVAAVGLAGGGGAAMVRPMAGGGGCAARQRDTVSVAGGELAGDRFRDGSL